MDFEQIYRISSDSFSNMGKTEVREDHNIPYDILIEILKRLPVKFLIQFQCVCKDWRNIIKSQCFIRDHLHHNGHQNPLLLLTRWHSIRLCDLRNGLLDRHSMQEVLEIQKPALTDSSPHLMILGSSNGLVCVEVVNGIMRRFRNNCGMSLVLCIEQKAPSFLLLWNPATRQFREVPRTVKDFDFNCDYCFGFGFSPIDNDYKIVRVYLTRACFAVNPVEVYSLNSGSWKEVEFENLEGISIIGGENVTVNGVMYWFGGIRSLDVHYNRVVSIDPTKQVCTSMPLPWLHLEYEKDNRPKLIVYENKLAVAAVTKSYLIHLWVMEEDACASRGRSIWTKRYTSNLREMMLYPYLHPMTIWRNHIVFHPFRGDGKKQRLCLLNLTTNEFKTLVIECGTINVNGSCNYVESLVSVGDISYEES